MLEIRIKGHLLQKYNTLSIQKKDFPPSPDPLLGGNGCKAVRLLPYSRQHIYSTTSTAEGIIRATTLSEETHQYLAPLLICSP